MNKRALLLVDVSNLYHTVIGKFGGRKLDYRKLIINCLPPDFEIYRKIAFGAELGDEATSFKAFLRELGFELRYKPIVEYPTDIPGKVKRKGDQDVAIAIEAVRILDMVDAVVFATADGDLCPAIEYIQCKGKLAFVIGCKLNYNLSMIADRAIEISESELEC